MVAGASQQIGDHGRAGEGSRHGRRWLLDTVLVWDEAGEKRSPPSPRGWRAGRMEAEQGAAARQQVEVRGTDFLIAVAPQRESRQAFGKDQEDVRPRLDTSLSQQGRGACQE